MSEPQAEPHILLPVPGKKKKNVGNPTSVWFPKGMLERVDKKRGLASRSVIVQKLVGMWLNRKISLKAKPKKYARPKRRKA